MKENDIIKAKKVAEEIVNLVHHKNRDEIGESLANFMIESHKAKDLTNRLADKEYIAIVEAKVNGRDKERDIEQFVTHLNHLKVRKRNKIKLYLATGVAVAAILTLSFLIFNSTTDSTSPEMVVQSETAIEKPVLIRESGEQLIVDAEESKIVATDFNQEKDSSDVVTKNRLVIPSKNSFTIVLSDGTEVTLNAQSELEYPSKFTGDRREVKVKGEAYFKVTKSKTPFVVKIGDGEVKVYGTAFNIKEKASKEIETVLVSGSVGIKYQNGNEIMMKPNQRVVINANEYKIEDVDALQYTGWLTNSFQYYNTEARSVIEDIEHWYGINIKEGDKISETEKISFNVDRTYSIAKIMTLLEGALGVTIINEGGDTYRIN